MMEESKNVNSGAKEQLKVTRGALIRSFLIWLNFYATCHTYQRMYGCTFAASMIPVFKILYKNNKEEFAAALKRHDGFYITEPSTGCVINGILISMEEQRANGAEEITGESMEVLKTSLMGAIAGFGDTIFTGTLRPLGLSVFVPIAMTGNIIGSIGYLLFKTAARTVNGAFWMNRGYKLGTSALTDLLSSGNAKIRVMMEGASVLSMFVMGAMAANYVKPTLGLSYTSGETVITLQSVLDKALPGILPLGVTMLIYFLLSKKINPIKIILGIMVVCLICSAFGLF